MTKPFHFKEFSIEQDKCAMKIGTDGVLLGAWTQVDDAVGSVLDIGTGTGIIALMLAQKSNAELIDAIEIDDNAYEQAVENFENSPWADRLFCYHASIDEFVEEMEEEKYDLIVCNPPFYTEDTKPNNLARNLARSALSMPLENLMSSASALLADEGNFALIIPYSEEEKLLNLAKEFNLFPRRITRVRGTRDSSVKRSLLQLSFLDSIVEKKELILEINRHQYTEDYKDLVRDFYLKM